MHVGGVILCGGQSQRMGRPKAWLPFAGELMLSRVARLLREAVAPIVVVAAPGQNLPALAQDVKVVRDEIEARGPLQGLAAGLAALTGLADAAFVCGCDVPFLQPAFVGRMIELLGDHQICVPCVGGFHQTMAAVYRVELLDVVRNLLAEDRLAVKALFEAVPTRVVPAEELRDVDPALGTLRNLNTPEDYAQALRDAGG